MMFITRFACFALIVGLGLTAPGRAEMRFEIGPVQIYGPNGREPDGLVRTALPSGIALCKAMGIAPDAPCDEDVILEGAQTQTDRSLWVDKIVSGGHGPPADNCLRAVAIASYRGKDRGTSPDATTFACFTPEAEDAITAADFARIQAAVARYNAIRNKTLAQHQRARDLRRLYVWIKEPLP